jgi:hypothetical protein
VSSSAQIVARALRRLKVIGAGEDPSADDAADGLAALNAMIAGWEADGVKVSGDVPLDARFEEGVVALLAVRLADDYGTSPSAGVVRDAENGWARLQAAFNHVPLAQFDTALRNMPSQRYWLSVGNPDLWAQKTAYSVGDQVQSNGRLYECTVAGTSGILAPLGTASSISDGTVTWQFVRNL